MTRVPKADEVDDIARELIYLSGALRHPRGVDRETAARLRSQMEVTWSKLGQLIGPEGETWELPAPGVPQGR